MYSVLKKNIANIPDATRNIETFAVDSERVRKIERRTSGAAARSSMTTKADEQHGGDHEEADRRRRAPAVPSRAVTIA